eukprot:scaffold55382_cov96-Phaeocystis_antarctica.AAC.1
MALALIPRASGSGCCLLPGLTKWLLLWSKEFYPYGRAVLRQELSWRQHGVSTTHKCGRSARYPLAQVRPPTERVHRVPRP